MKNQRIKVLIIDDEESIRDSMKWHLEEMGCKVITASDPTVCSVYCHEKCTAKDRCADVLFIDQNMPDMTGLEFVEMQSRRGCKLSPKCKMVISGIITDDVRSQAEALGCQIAQKPFPLQKADAFVGMAKFVKEEDK